VSPKVLLLNQGRNSGLKHSLTLLKVSWHISKKMLQSKTVGKAAGYITSKCATRITQNVPVISL
jgi:hypothetical protein